MSKLLGLLPYLYFFDEPIKLGETTLFSLPDTEGRDFSPREQQDRDNLYRLVACFPVHRGLESDRGVIRAYTYFLTDSTSQNDAQLYGEAKKAITLLRYMMLRPDNQGLKDLETSAVYTFDLPPAVSKDTRIYHMWANFNQEEWVTPSHRIFYPPGWDVDLQMVHTSNLENLYAVNSNFYGGNLDSTTEASVLLAIEWYNLSFSKYTFRGGSGQLVDIATAFEALLQLPKYKKTKAFIKSLRNLLGINGNSIIDDWATSFYGDVRSETVHTGKPLTYAFKHPQALTPHLSFLWSAQKIFRECVAAKVGLERHVANSWLIEDLIPNEVILAELRTVKSYEELKEKSHQIWKLRQRYPVGKSEDIILLGNILLNEMAKQVSQIDLLPLKKIIESILKSPPDEDILWPQYVTLQKELSEILFRGNVEKAKQLSTYISLAQDVEKFAGFAWFALQMGMEDGKQRNR
jgi:hypothetical protein